MMLRSELDINRKHMQVEASPPKKKNSQYPHAGGGVGTEPCRHFNLYFSLTYLRIEYREHNTGKQNYGTPHQNASWLVKQLSNAYKGVLLTLRNLVDQS